MRATWKKLLEFLKACEQRKGTFTIEDAAAASGLSASSISTYISKKMRGVWVDPVDEQHFSVHDLVSVSVGEFERLMTQKSSTPHVSAEEWQARMRALLVIGREQGYVDPESALGAANSDGISEGKPPLALEAPRHPLTQSLACSPIFLERCKATVQERMLRVVDLLVQRDGHRAPLPIVATALS